MALFDKVSFWVAVDDGERLETTIAQYGGMLVERLTALVDFVIDSDTKGRGARLVKTRGLSQTLVNPLFVDACIAAGKVLPVSKFKLTATPVLAPPAPAVAVSPARAAAPGKKRELSDVEDDDGKDEKASSPVAKKKATASVSAPAPAVVTKKILVKGRAAVDSEAHQYVATHHVLDQAGVVWECLLNQTQIAQASFGRFLFLNLFSFSSSFAQNSNKFFVIQALAADAPGSKEEFVLFTRWGRVGLGGQSKAERCANVEALKKAFAKKFYDKSGNKWGEEFEARSGKYVLLLKDYGVEEGNEKSKAEEQKKKEELKLAVAKKPEPAVAPGPAASVVFQASGKSAPAQQQQQNVTTGDLPADVVPLIEMIFDKASIERTLASFSFDIHKCPLGKLKKATLLQGLAVLKKIEQEIEKGASNAKLADLSSQYYSLVPHSFGMSVPPTILSARLPKEIELVAALGEIDVATEIMGAAQGSTPQARYAQLKARIAVERDAKTLEQLHKSIRSTHGSTHPHNTYTIDIIETYAVDRPAETAAFAEFAHWPNRQLLYHGSRMTNFVGILSQGLRIAPPEAPVTGAMFGKGLYFANCASKSANYCAFSPEHPDGLLIVCEVALGECHVLTKADSSLTAKTLPSGKESTLGRGKHTPSADEAVAAAGAAKLPMGPLVDSGVGKSSLLYDEYVVYSLSRVRIRHVVHFRARFA